MDFKEKVKTFLALSSSVLLTTLSEGVKAEQYSAEKPLTQIALSDSFSKKELKSVRDIIEERLNGAKSWIENSRELERLFGDNIPFFPLEVAFKGDTIYHKSACLSRDRGWFFPCHFNIKSSKRVI